MLLIRLWDDSDDDAFADTPIYGEFCCSEGCVRKLDCDVCKTCNMHCTCFTLTPPCDTQHPCG